MSQPSFVDNIHYDGLWKMAIEGLSKECIEFFLPEFYQDIDFSKPITFLKQDLSKIDPDGKKKGDVVKDNMIQVHMKNGNKGRLLIHLEAEAGHESNFSRRMFVYFYRSYDKYPYDITATAIFLGQQIPTKPAKFIYKCGRMKATFEYPIYAVRDQKEEELLKSNNPFALAILACKYVLESRKEKTEAKKFEKRLALKVKITNFLREHFRKREYSEEKKHILIKFVLNILLLPQKYQESYYTTIFEPYENSKPMHMEPTAVDISFANALMKVLYGETGESLHQKLEKQKEASAQDKLLIQQLKLEMELAIQKAAKEKKILAQKAAEEKKILAQKAAEEKKILAQKAAKEKKILAQKAAEEKKILAQKAAEEKRKTALKLHKNMNWSIEQIASFMELPAQTIKKLLGKHD